MLLTGKCKEMALVSGGSLRGEISVGPGISGEILESHLQCPAKCLQTNKQTNKQLGKIDTSEKNGFS